MSTRIYFRVNALSLWGGEQALEPGDPARDFGVCREYPAQPGAGQRVDEPSAAVAGAAMAAWFVVIEYRLHIGRSGSNSG